MTTDTSSTPHKPHRRVVMNTTFAMLGKLQSGLFSYFSTLILLRALKVEEYGLWALLFIGTTGNLGLIARLGLTNSIRRFIPEYFAKSNFRIIAKLYRVSTLLQLAASVLLVLIVFVLAEPIARWMHFTQSPDLLRIFAVGALAYLLGDNVRLVLAGLFMHRTIFMVTTIYSILRLGAIFAASQFADPFLMVIIAEVTLYFVVLGFYAIAYRRFVRPRILADQHSVESPPWKRFTRYTLLSYVSEIGVMLLNNATDLFLVTGYMGAAMVALYGLTNRIMALVHNILPNQFLQDVITPLFHSEYGADPKQARFGFNMIVKASLLVTIPLGIWLGLMAEPLIASFFDARYTEAAAVLMIMAFFLPMETLRYPLGLMLQNAERNDLLIYGKIFGVFKILTGLWLLPQGHLTTMAWISMLAIVGQNSIFYFWIVRLLKSPLDHRGLLRQLANGIVCAGVLYLTRPYFHGAIGVIVSVILIAGLWLGLCILNRAFTKEERDFINSKLPRPIWWF